MKGFDLFDRLGAIRRLSTYLPIRSLSYDGPERSPSNKVVVRN